MGWLVCGSVCGFVCGFYCSASRFFRASYIARCSVMSFGLSLFFPCRVVPNHLQSVMVMVRFVSASWCSSIVVSASISAVSFLPSSVVRVSSFHFFSVWCWLRVCLSAIAVFFIFSVGYDVKLRGFLRLLVPCCGWLASSSCLLLSYPFLLLFVLFFVFFR